MTAYYNEIDPFAAAWLRELIKAGHIAPGIVDERSIEDITPNELRDVTQCHFFAGIGVWSYALRQAGWPDDRRVWTGSCPCQPFSAAGKGGGAADERHLWPAWFHLIEQCRPDVVFGEQVEAAIRHSWLDLVQTDMENQGYAFAAFGLPAAGFGAPHIRARLFFVAESESEQHDRAGNARGRRGQLTDGCESGSVADSNQDGLIAAPGRGLYDAEHHTESRSILGDPEHTRLEGYARDGDAPGPVNGFWRNAEWLPCIDGKARPVEPGTSPLAHGAPARVVRLRGYGNAINAEVATEFVEAYLTREAIPTPPNLPY